MAIIAMKRPKWEEPNGWQNGFLERESSPAFSLALALVAEVFAVYPTRSRSAAEQEAIKDSAVIFFS
jgi:hypothetical protein